MSYKEKRKITEMAVGLAVIIAYCIHALGRYHQGLADLNDFKYWAGTMLVFIGISIGVVIIIEIFFHIVYAVGIAVREREKDEKEIGKTIESSMVEDEMDKLIELKSLRIGYSMTGFGVLAGLVSLVLNAPPAVMLNLLYACCALGSLAEGVMSLFYYRKGVKNG
jgi:hypothetical protein